MTSVQNGRVMEWRRDNGRVPSGRMEEEIEDSFTRLVNAMKGR
jgi:hypothetical protein